MLIIDNFYSNPDEIRAEALAADYAPTQTTGRLYPGRASKWCYLKDYAVAKVEDAIGKKIKSDTSGWQFGRYRFALSGDGYDRLIHFDGAEWAAILYLTPNEISKNPPGTIFWRHKESGSTVGQDSGVDYAPITFDLDKWEKVYTCTDTYNRMLLFNPQCWHSVGDIYGDTLENSRLTQTFFFWSDVT